MKETADAATMKAWADHAANDNKDHPDKITQYYNAKAWAEAAKNGMDGVDGKGNPVHIPATGGTADAKSVDMLMDKAAVDAGLKLANDPEVQAWLAKTAATSLDKVISDNSYKVNPSTASADGMGTTPVTETGIKFPPGTSAESLAKAQQDYLNDPKTKDAVGKMSPADRADWIKTAVDTLGTTGISDFDAKGIRNNLINDAAKANGEPQVVIDKTTNDFVKNGAGQTLVNDPASKQNVAIDSHGKVVVDDKTKAPLVYNDHGVGLKDSSGNNVTLGPGNTTVATDAKGESWIVDTKAAAADATGKTAASFVKDPSGNYLLVDKDSKQPVAKDAAGNYVLDKASNQKILYNPENGKAVTNANTGNNIVVDPKSKLGVEADKTSGEFVSDAKGNAYVVNTQGLHVTDPSGHEVVIEKNSNLPVSYDAQGVAQVADPVTGKSALTVTTPAGVTAKMILDPTTNKPIMGVVGANGQYLKGAGGQSVVLDKDAGVAVIEDKKTGAHFLVDGEGKTKVDSKGNTLVVDKTSSKITAIGPDNKPVADKSGSKIIYDPTTKAPVASATNPNNYIVVDPKSNLAVEADQTNGKYVTAPNGQVIVKDVTTGKSVTAPNGDAVTIDPINNAAVTTNKYGVTWVVNPNNGNYIQNKAGNYVVIDPVSKAPLAADANGKPVIFKDSKGKEVGPAVVSTGTGEVLQDASGKPFVIDPSTKMPAAYDESNGKFAAAPPQATIVNDANNQPIKTPDGNGVLAKDAKTGNYIPVDPITKQPLPDKSGLVPVLDANGKQVVNGDKSMHLDPTGVPIAVDANGKVEVDAKGNTVVYDKNGKQVTDGAGNSVVLEKESHAPVFADKNGTVKVDPLSNLPLIANPDTGKAVTSSSGNPVVLDKDSHMPVQVQNGKVVVDDKGNAKLADARNGEFVKTPEGNDVVIDKKTQMPVSYDPKTGVTSVVDPSTGKAIIDEKSGAKLELNKFSGLPELVYTDANGNKTLIDPTTHMQKVDENGNKVYIDQNTGQTIVYKDGVAYDYYLGNPASEATAAKWGSYFDAERKTFITIKNTLNTGYWGSAASLPDFKASAFHASRVFGAAMGAATLISMAPMWAPGTDRYNAAFERHDPVAIANFVRDLVTNFKYTNNEFTAIDNRFNLNFLKEKYGKLSPNWPLNDLQLAGDNTTLIMPDKANPGGWLRYVPGKESFTLGYSDPRPLPQWEKLPAGFDPKAPLGPDVFNTPGGAVRPGAAPGSMEVFNGNTLNWEPLTQNTAAKISDALQELYTTDLFGGAVKPGVLPNGNLPMTAPGSPFRPGEVLPAVGEGALSVDTAVWSALKTFGKWANIGGNIAMGGIQIFTGSVEIANGMTDNRPTQIFTGSLNVAGGALWVGAGIGVMLGAAWAGPVLALGFLAGAVAGIVQAFTDPNYNKPGSVRFTDTLEKTYGTTMWAPGGEAAVKDWYKNTHPPTYHPGGAKMPGSWTDEYGHVVPPPMNK